MSENVTRIFDIPAFQLANFPKEDAFMSKIDGKWQGYSTAAFMEAVNDCSKGLLKIGIERGDKIAMISNNRPEWNIMDIAILQVGAINVPIYPTISESDYQYIFNDATIKVCIVSDEELLEKVHHIQKNVPTLKDIYSFNSIAGTKNWTEIRDLGKDSSMEQVEAIKASIKDTDLATLIYTSGTTGTPKGVMLSHRNIVSNSKASAERLPVDFNSKALSFLPICHVYERMVLYLYMLNGTSVYFAESMETIGDNLREVKPEVFTAVPRLLEKVYDKIVTKGSDLTGIKKMLFYWALNLGLEYDVVGKGAFYKLQLGLARKIIFSKWREALGGNVKAVASGSAALQPRLARVFLAAGIPVMEGYGLTESSPVISVNCEENDGVRIGTVGRIIDGVEVKFAEDGEIWARGPNIMMGYYNKPEQTREVLDDEGWLHTGDIGELVEGQYLKITDRKKEIFKTSGGKYIAPQQVENKFKESRFIEQVMVVGENQKHPSALIVPAFEFLREWCKRKGLDCTTPSDIASHEGVHKKLSEEIDHLNQSFGKWEQIKKFTLIPEEWTVEGGQMTPTLKLKRRFISKKYAAEIADFYPDSFL